MDKHAWAMETTLTPDSAADDAAAKLREELIGQLTGPGWLHSPQIIEAFRAVQRHIFLPGVDLPTAYLNESVPIKHDAGGAVISCISQPQIVATQLEQLGLRPGDRMLEAGAGTGYNAALAGHIVGPTGHVWTVDVDTDLVEGAAANLAAAGAENVTVLLADGAAGLPEHAPFDRIQLTVGAADLPTALLNQLAPGGRIVLPLRLIGSISRSFALEPAGSAGLWTVVSHEMASFVPLRQGILNDTCTVLDLDGADGVKLETFPEQDVDRDALRRALTLPGHTVDVGVEVRIGFNWEWLYLWLAGTLPNGLSRMPGKAGPGFAPHFPWGSMAALDGDTLAYLTLREEADAAGPYWVAGVIGHGPAAADLAERVADAFRAWDRHGGNAAARPSFRMAAGEARTALPTDQARFVIDKPASRIAVDWP